MKDESFSLREGTISFWIAPAQVDYSDGKSYQLFEKSSPEGSVFIVKDSDNRMKFFHVVLGRGRSDVEYDVSDLEPNQRHMFAFTWSTEAQKLKIFIDGEEAACSNMAHPSAVSA